MLMVVDEFGTRYPKIVLNDYDQFGKYHLWRRRTSLLCNKNQKSNSVCLFQSIDCGFWIHLIEMDGNHT